MQVIWEIRAEQDLVEYQDYIHQFNPEASIQVVDRIFACLDTLVDQPLTGKPGRIHGTREFAIPDLPLTLIYRMQEVSLIVVVLHHRRKKPFTE
nr:type II toxin-antitoxin system RelE/ParE family toxin [Endozoicomonas sp.]